MTVVELREVPAERGGVASVELEAWRTRFGLVAGITLREAEFGLGSPAPTSQVLDRWLGFRRQVMPQFTSVVVARQCHGTHLAQHDGEREGWSVLDDTDGHLTRRPGMLVTVTVADCVPVYLLDDRGPWLGLLHAGWRGIAQGMVEHGIASLARASGSPVSNILIHCGVSICGDCYEVGPEVLAAVTGRKAQRAGRLDLRSEVARRALGAGVREVTVSPWCTAHDRDRFHSHRRSRGTDGRMVAYVGRPLA